MQTLSSIEDFLLLVWIFHRNRRNCIHEQERLSCSTRCNVDTISFVSMKNAHKLLAVVIRRIHAHDVGSYGLRETLGHTSECYS